MGTCRSIRESVGDVTIVDLNGKMTLGEGDELLRDKVNSLIQQGQKKIILNLSEVPYIDSAGLGEIVRTYTTVSRQGGSLEAAQSHQADPGSAGHHEAVDRLRDVRERAGRHQELRGRRLALLSALHGAQSTSGDRDPGRLASGERPGSIPPGQPARLAPAGTVDQEPRCLRGAAVRPRVVRARRPVAGARRRGLRDLLRPVGCRLPGQRRRWTGRATAGTRSNRSGRSRRAHCPPPRQLVAAAVIGGAALALAFWLRPAFGWVAAHLPRDADGVLLAAEAPGDPRRAHRSR